MAETDEGPTLKSDVKWGVAVMLVVILGVATLSSGLWTGPPAGVEHMTQYQGPDGPQPGLTEAIFGQWVVAFEILGVLLLASLVGAIVIAAREENI